MRGHLAVVAAALLLAGCDAGADTNDSGAETSSPAASPSASSAPAAGHSKPLRDGERFLDVSMPEPYTPKAPYGAGTDDYRCFLLDPGLTHDAFLTGIDVRPGNADVVHHVILFRVPPDQVAAAEAQDAGEYGEGWTCFGGTGLERSPDELNNAPWIGAWAPGGGEQVHAGDVGIPLAEGSRIVMQVHYNLLAGHAPDLSSAQLRLAPGDADLAPLQTVLLPAPVELPCRPGHRGALCDRDAAVADTIDRFGSVGRIADGLHFVCGPIDPGPVQSCTWPAAHDMTIRAVAGHMHLLGRQVSIDVGDRRILHIGNWNFDDQGADAVEPVHVAAGDDITVTCRHSQVMRDRVPALQGQPERYVVWGEGTTDEMCLGILLVTRG